MTDSVENADHFLVEQIRGGSESAWRQLIDRCSAASLALRLGDPACDDARS